MFLSWQSSDEVSAVDEIQFWHSCQLASSCVTTEQGITSASPPAADYSRSEDI